MLDGRDIGTAVVPEADVKIYVTATPEVRARRRTEELRAKGRDIAYETILAEIVARDARDAGRATAPLAIAADAIILDTSALDAEAVFRQAIALVEARRARARQAREDAGFQRRRLRLGSRRFGREGGDGMMKLIWTIIGILILVHAYFYVRYQQIDPCAAALTKVEREDPAALADVTAPLAEPRSLDHRPSAT